MIIELFQGYVVKKRIKGQKWPAYVQYIHSNKIAYTLDYTHARIYKSEKTALKNDKKIPETISF